MQYRFLGERRTVAFHRFTVPCFLTCFPLTVTSKAERAQLASRTRNKFMSGLSSAPFARSSGWFNKALARKSTKSCFPSFTIVPGQVREGGQNRRIVPGCYSVSLASFFLNKNVRRSRAPSFPFGHPFVQLRRPSLVHTDRRTWMCSGRNLSNLDSVSICRMTFDFQASCQWLYWGMSG